MTFATARGGWAEQAAEKPLQAVIPSPFAVILSPSPVILSEAKNLRSWLRVNSATNLALSIFNAVRDSSSSANKNGGLLGMTGQTGFSAACLAQMTTGSAACERLLLTDSRFWCVCPGSSSGLVAAGAAPLSCSDPVTSNPVPTSVTSFRPQFGFKPQAGNAVRVGLLFYSLRLFVYYRI